MSELLLPLLRRNPVDRPTASAHLAMLKALQGGLTAARRVTAGLEQLSRIGEAVSLIDESVARISDNVTLLRVLATNERRRVVAGDTRRCS